MKSLTLLTFFILLQSVTCLAEPDMSQPNLKHPQISTELPLGDTIIIPEYGDGGDEINSVRNKTRRLKGGIILKATYEDVW